MQMHAFQRPTTHKISRRVGRGGKRGTYSGRGMKGQKSRAGANIRPAFRDIFAHVPKLRGAQRKGQTRGRAVFVTSVSLARIERAYAAQETVSPRTLAERQLVHHISGRIPAVKILASGTLAKSLRFENCSFSQKAREAIEKAGGIINE